MPHLFLFMLIFVSKLQLVYETLCSRDPHQSGHFIKQALKITIATCEREIVKMQDSFAWQLCVRLISTQQLVCSHHTRIVPKLLGIRGLLALWLRLIQVMLLW